MESDNTLFFISKDRLNKSDKKGSAEVECDVVTKYKKTTEEIKKRKAWKSSDDGNINRLMMSFSGMDLGMLTNRIAVSGIAYYSPDGIVYSTAFDNCTTLYKKSTSTGEETLILRNNNLSIYEMDCSKSSGKIVASCSVNSYEKGLGLFDIDSPNYKIITEGECFDQNPVFFENDRFVYYDSCGIGYNSTGRVSGISQRSILKLNLSDGEIDEVVSNPKFDFMKPKFDVDGNMYYIKKPYGNHKKSQSFVDFLLIPVKIFKAIFGWLNFFTIRYTGESLKSSGVNPDKAKQKSQEDLYVEGNLIYAEKAITENKNSGENFPGSIPRSWELIRRNKSGEETVIKKGVLDYCISQSGEIFYSNGKYINKLSSGKKDEMICEAELAAKLTIY